ncbi:zinc finger and BTB domain-containing protein 14-like isoform X2 [Culicoides brevitarsis]|uniref:zinc finger and BTB domain-containing protein 14-like isoform X2 n=1 Tax=Culicoides brevitarsis TaxID=469753 RepID=UPI00307C49FC
MAETDPSQQYCVRWNSHLCSLSTAFPQLLDQEKFVDVTLACEGQQVHCHKVVLAACSQYFDNLLSENPCKHPIIILPSDIKLWTIQALVEFMYKGQVNVSQAGLPDLVKSGDLLQIRGLCNTDIGLSVENGSEVSKVPTNATTTSPAASVRKESERVSEDQESTIKTETYDLEDEEVTDDPKNPEKTSFKSVTITQVKASTSSGQIRVRARENLFENYKKAEVEPEEDEYEMIQVTPDTFHDDDGTDDLIMMEPPKLKFNQNTMEVKKINLGQAFSLKNIDEESFFSIDDDEIEAEYILPEVSMMEQTTQQKLPRLLPKINSVPIKNPGVLLRHPRANQGRAYTEEELITALNEIKAGLSIYKASQKYRVPRKTLRNWMKRWKIKSAHPMPIQLQRAAIKRKEERDQRLRNGKRDS